MQRLLDDQQRAEDETTIAALRAANKELSRDADKLRVQLGKQRLFSEQVAGSIKALDPYPYFRYSRAQKTCNPIVPVLEISDLHVGEVVQPNEVEGFNKFNWAIAQAGLFGIVTDFLQWVEVQRGFYTIEECAVMLKGDYVSGDIHAELLATNEFPLPVQTANAGTLIGEVLRRVAGHFKRVTVWGCGADNHGRLQPKPQAKQKAANSMSFLVHHIAASAVSRCPNIRMELSEGIKQLATVNGKRFLIMHGDTLKGWAGLPWYAFAREAGREAIRRMFTSKGFHYLGIAHFHTPCFHEARVLVNGSLSGTSEFDYGCGRHALPCQIAYMVHPSFGVFNFTPFIRRDVKQPAINQNTISEP